MKKMLNLKRMCLITGLLTLAATPVLAAEEMSSAASGLYLGGSIGIAQPADSDVKYSVISDKSTIEFDSGLALGAAIGYGFGNNVRVEGEIGYQKNDMDKQTFRGVTEDVSGDVNMWSFTGNVYYDFVNSSPLTPYIGAGLGFDKVEYNADGISVDDTVPVAQFGAGVGYAVSNKVILDLKYRYMTTLSDPEFEYSGVTFEPEVASHNLMVGLRFAL